MGPARVLVADDDRFMRALVRQTLTEGGLVVTEAADGRAALEAVRADPPDVLVLDLMMPHLDGFQVLAALEADGLFDALQVIVLTGRASHEVLTRALEAGAADYIAKP
ncbi:MAG: response regulator, partial [Myxococcales bacterium]|nr:response regulator [Myxococcales bacterium]